MEISSQAALSDDDVMCIIDAMTEEEEEEERKSVKVPMVGNCDTPPYDRGNECAQRRSE